MATFYAWSNIMNGGKTEMRETASGQPYRVILERNITKFGEKITKKSSGLSDEEWDHKIENGVIRPYAPPKDVPEDTSPAQHVVNQVLKGNVQLEPGKLMELSLLAGMSQNASFTEDDAEAEGEAVPVGA